VALTTGGESDTFTRDPVPTSLLVEAVQRDGTRTTLADAGLPSATDIDLGSPSSTTVASIQVTARDSTGTTVVSGASPFLELLALQGVTLPVFVQRNGDLARMPGTLPDSRSAPLVTASGRGIYGAGGLLAGFADGGAPPVFGYDLAFLEQFSSECSATRTPRSMVLENAALLLVDDAGATVVDLSSCTNADLGALADAGVPTWAAVSGGAAVYGEDGSGYIVGPSKPDFASNAIVKVDTSGTVTTASVITARKGAATAWATGKGLFVYGGSGSGDGVEILSSGGTSASAPKYPSDATAGLLAVQLDANTMLLLGSSTLATVDLGCANNPCAVQPWGNGWPLSSVKVTPTALFKVATGVFVAVGDDAQGATHVFRLESTQPATEVPLKIPRNGARAVQTPTGAVVILGGGTTTLEAYVP